MKFLPPDDPETIALMAQAESLKRQHAVFRDNSPIAQFVIASYIKKYIPVDRRPAIENLIEHVITYFFVIGLREGKNES